MSGSLIGGIAGAAIGFFFPVIGPALGWAIGSLAGGLLFPQKGPDGPRLEDLRPQSSEYGRPIPIVYGTIGLGGNVIWASDLVEEEGEAGGKGGGGGGSTFSYYGNFAVAICEGSADIQLGRIWAGPEKRLIWDGATLEGADAGAALTFYNGEESQLPDPLMESYEGVGNVPAYRGTAYVVLEHFPLAKDGNRIPFLTIEVGRVAVSVNNGPANIGIAWASKVVIGASRMYYFYTGSYDGVIVRSLTRTGTADYPIYSLYRHLTYPSPDWSSDPEEFSVADAIDKAVVAGGSRLFSVIDFATGIRTEHELSPPVGADANLGTNIFGHCYLNGKYLFATKGGGTGRVGLWIVDPSDPDTVEAAYAADSGAASAPLLMRPPPGASGTHVYILSADRVTKHEIASAGAVTNLGNPLGTDYMDVDPNTGLIWTCTTGVINSGNLTVTVHSPTTGLVNAFGPSLSSFYQVTSPHPITFTPSNGVYVTGELYLSTDIFHAYSSDGLTDNGEIVGGYHGIQDRHAILYNPVEDELLAFRYAGYVSTGAPSDITSVNFLLPAGVTQEPDNWYIASTDSTTGVDLAGQQLSEIVADLSERAGLTAAEYDVAALTDTVDGYAVASQTSVRDAITALMPAYFFDAAESDGKVKFVKRGGAIAVAVPDDDVGSFVAGTDPPDPLETTRAMENELPRTLNVKYILAATNYSVAARSAKRLVGASGEERTLDFPVVMTDTKAQEVAEVNLHGAWVARLSYSFTLSRKYGYLEPTDIIVVYGHTMRLTKTVNADGVIKCESVHDDSNVYVPNVVVTETPPTGGSVALNTEIALELM